MRLLYHAYELQRAWLSSASAWASIGAELMSNPRYPAAYFGMGPMAAASLEVFAHATQPRGKPAFDIEAVTVDGTAEPVTEAIVYNKPFGDLRRFASSFGAQAMVDRCRFDRTRTRRCCQGQQREAVWTA